MNNKKTLLTTSIIIILIGTTQANDYISIISQEKNVYNIIENSIPVATEWLDIGSEFSCVKEFSEYDYPLGESFTQNENCLQKQERTVTTTQLFNGNPRTTVETENQNIPVVISYLETGQENYNTGTQRFEYTTWLDDGIHYACGDFSPLTSTVNLGQNFNQNRSCSQDQERTETVYDIWADGSEIFDVTNIETRILTELEYNAATGSKNFDTGTNRTEYTNWLNDGTHYACTTFTPLVSTVNLGESFIQDRDCSQDQERTKTVYNIWATGSETLNSTNIETQTLTENETQSAIGTKNFITGIQRTEYTNWLDSGIHYNCSAYTPLDSEFYSGKTFDRNRNCSQDQNRTETIYDIWENGNETLNSANVETQILTENEADTGIGALLLKSCNEIIVNGHSNGDGIYQISPLNNSFPVYCDMTTDGGGWTNVAYNFGNIIAINNENGVDINSVSTSFVNGALKSVSNNTCGDNMVYSKLTSEFVDLIDFSEVLLNAKSYGSGDIRCGGIMRQVAESDNYTKLNTFNTGALYRCDNNSWYDGETPGLGFSEEKNTSDLIFKFTLTNSENRFASLNSACGVGSSHIKLNKILVR